MEVQLLHNRLQGENRTFQCFFSKQCSLITNHSKIRTSLSCLRDKRLSTITFSTKGIEKVIRSFYFVEKLCSVLKILKFLSFYTSHDLPNLRRHDEYQYMRQGAFLNMSFEPQLMKLPNLAH